LLLLAINGNTKLLWQIVALLKERPLNVPTTVPTPKKTHAKADLSTMPRKRHNF